MEVVPPKETNPPPLNPVPVDTVTDELAKLPLEIDPAGSDKPPETARLDNDA